MHGDFLSRIEAELETARETGVFKPIRVLDGPQGPVARMEGRGPVLVLCSNNYLGLADEPEVRQAAREAIDRYGNGMASARFICGTLKLHAELETATASFLRKEAATTFTSCWNANEALFATLLGEGDLIASDSLNHASIVDGIRLVKGARREIFPHNDVAALRTILQAHRGARTKMIVTDGVFSMDGYTAKLPEICAVADEFGALVVVDDSHATGVLGRTGRGTMEHFDLWDGVDIVTGTYGKALGGAAGGFIAAPKPVIEYLVQRARPQIFSNALPPAVAAAALASLRFLEAHPERVAALRENAAYFRKGVERLGFRLFPGETPILPVIVGDAALAIRMSEALLEEGVFLTGFGFPVVPKGEARLRIQISAVHERKHLDRGLEALEKVGRRMGVIR